MILLENQFSIANVQLRNKDIGGIIGSFPLMIIGEEDIGPPDGNSTVPDSNSLETT